MAIQRNMNDECLKHALEINNLKHVTEALTRHHNMYKNDIDNLFAFMQDFKVSLVKIENNIEKNIDTPNRLRKLEDKSMFLDVLNKLAWIGVGALVSLYITQSFKQEITRKNKNITEISK